MIGKYIYGKLSVNAALIALVSDRIYPITREEESELPAVIYDVTAINPVDTKESARLDEVSVDISSFATDSGTAYQIIDLVRTALDRISSSANGVTVDDCWVENYQEQKIDETEIYSSSYTFKFRMKK